MPVTFADHHRRAHHRGLQRHPVHRLDHGGDADHVGGGQVLAHVGARQLAGEGDLLGHA